MFAKVEFDRIGWWHVTPLSYFSLYPFICNCLILLPVQNENEIDSRDKVYDGERWTLIVDLSNKVYEYIYID